MASLVATTAPAFSGRCISSPSSSTSSSASTSLFSHYAFPQYARKIWSGNRTGRKMGVCRAMVQQAAVQGASANYAKEMERLSAKESLLLAAIPNVVKGIQMVKTKQKKAAPPSTLI